jgi:hypothetical protein
MKPLDEEGIVDVRRFGGNVQAYYQGLIEVYRTRHRDVTRWVERTAGDELYIACWCPHSRTSKRQLSLFNSFVCHTLAVGWVLEHGYGWEIVQDKARARDAVQIV